MAQVELVETRKLIEGQTAKSKVWKIFVSSGFILWFSLLMVKDGNQQKFWLGYLSHTCKLYNRRQPISKGSRVRQAIGSWLDLEVIQLI
jgi:hypothetical protein